MRPAAHVIHGAPAALVLAALTGIVLAPDSALGQEQERVRVRAEPAPAGPPTPAMADGWLGLSVLQEVGLDREGSFSAITVTRVAPGGPAAHAGLRPRDRVVRVNGRPATPALFNQIASTLGPGEVMRLTVERPTVGSMEIALTAASPPENVTVFLPSALQARVDSSLHRLDSLQLTIARTDRVQPAPAPSAMPSQGPRGVLLRSEAAAARGGGAAPEPARPLLPWLEGRSWVAGARFTPLNADLATYFEVDGGLLVTETLDATPLPAAGLRPGDVVLSVDGRSVRTIDAIRGALARVGPEGVTLTIVRHGKRLELRLEP